MQVGARCRTILRLTLGYMWQRAAKVHALASRLVRRLAAALPPSSVDHGLVLPPHLMSIVAAPSTPESHRVSVPPTEGRQRRLSRVPPPQAPPPPPITSPIIPLLTPSPRPLSAFLRTKGFLVRAITYPTVPRGQERIRVCLHARNEVREVDGLVEALGEWVSARGEGAAGKVEEQEQGGAGAVGLGRMGGAQVALRARL